RLVALSAVPHDGDIVVIPMSGTWPFLLGCPMPVPGLETEFGVPIPGEIRPESEWARTAIKRLPPPGPLNWRGTFGREAPVVIDLGCGNGRYTLLSALARPDHDHFASDILPVVIRYATRRANQRGLHNVRFAVKDAQIIMSSYVAA